MPFPLHRVPRLALSGAVLLLTGLAACAPQMPDDAAGTGSYSDYMRRNEAQTAAAAASGDTANVAAPGQPLDAVGLTSSAPVNADGQVIGQWQTQGVTATDATAAATGSNAATASGSVSGGTSGGTGGGTGDVPTDQLGSAALNALGLQSTGQ